MISQRFEVTPLHNVAQKQPGGLCRIDYLKSDEIGINVAGVCSGRQEQSQGL
jgi:hypothetical protein